MIAPLRFLPPEGTDITITHEVPEDQRIPFAVPTLTRWQTGSLLEQYILKKNIGLFFITFSISQRIAFRVESLQNFNTIQYTLKGETLALLRGHGFLSLLANTYTPMYIPTGSHSVWFEPGEYQYFYIFLADDHLDELAQDHPYLETLIMKLKTQSKQGLLLDRMIINTQVLDTINRLRQLDENTTGLFLELQQVCIDLMRLYNNQILARSKPALYLSAIDYVLLVKMYIIDNIGSPEKTNIKSLISLFPTTPRTLERNFLNEFHLPLRDFIKKERLKRALYMLVAEEGSITEIADKLGYYDVYTFSKLFTDHYGFSPKNAKEQFYTYPNPF